MLLLSQIILFVIVDYCFFIITYRILGEHKSYHGSVKEYSERVGGVVNFLTLSFLRILNDQPMLLYLQNKGDS